MRNLLGMIISGFSYLLFIHLVLISITSCKSECNDNSNCNYDEVCIDGRCQSRACTSNLECPMEYYCSWTKGECLKGCTNDEDCYPGRVCVGGDCKDRGCRSTTLDCHYGEFCNEATGECFQAEGYYCKECSSDLECGGGGNRCLIIGDYTQGYCGVDCSEGQECPRGYDCIQLYDSFGNILGMNCITLCEDL